MSAPRAVIFANGLLPDPEAVRRLIRPGDRLIAADGGARHALALGLTPHLIVGDLDSLRLDERDDLERSGARFELHPAQKDETDLELALIRAAEEGAESILILGAIGGRLDMTMANVLLLLHPRLAGLRVELWSDRQVAWLIRPPGDDAIRGAAGDTFSLIPLGGEAVGITTHGLAYPLENETLAFGPARGVSNVLAGPTARLELRGGTLLAVLTAGSA
jgi:thiamine pyrophosphokinase